MAGIGFRLRKLLESQSIINHLKAYLHGAIISCGPWLITIVVISMIGIFQSHYLSNQEITVFRISIVYVYCFSLIIFGFFQMPTTRYLADALFLKNYSQILPTYFSSLIVIGAVLCAVGIPACFIFNDWEFIYQVHYFLVFISVTFVWVSMIFVSAVKDYYFITTIFAFGGALSILLSYYVKSIFGPSGYMMGFGLGQLFTFFGLSIRVMIEFPSDKKISFKFLGHFKLYPTLIMIGFMYNVAIWTDKFLFWMSNQGQHIDAFLHASFIYDQPMFLSYLTVVPSYSIFLVRTETNFYPYYRDYYQAIMNKAPMKRLLYIKKQMIEHSIDNIWFMIKVQGLFSLMVVLMAPAIKNWLKMDWFQMVIFRIGVLAAVIHSVLLLLFIFLLYFDFRKECLFVTLMFFFFNGIGTLISLIVGFPYFGAGYLTACVLTLFVGFWVMDYKLKHLEYLTFMKQPIG